MKKNLFYLFALICSMSLFTACNNDDDEGAFIDKELAGVYKGEMDIKLSLFPDPLVEGMLQKVYISRASDNAIQMELKNFSVALTPGGQPLPLGDIKVDRCTITENAGTYSFIGNQTLNLTSVGSCDVKVAGTIIGGKIDMDIAVDVKKPEMTVSVTFAGEKLIADQSSEAKILEFGFGDKLKGKTTIDGSQVLFTVEGTFNPDDFFSIVPVIKVSENAKIVMQPISEDDENLDPVDITVPQNFNNPITYIVTSEDGITITKYTVNVGAGNSSLYTFENWIADNSLYTDNIPLAIGGWANCNNAVSLIKNMGIMAGITYEGDYPVKASTESHSGKYAAEMISVDTKGGNMFGTKVPKVTAGSMFLGSFNAFAAMQDPMATTSFGVMYNKKPVEVKGFFKYKPGADFYNKDGKLELNRKDKCSMTAVFYEVSKEEDTLNGNDIYTSNKIVAKAIYNYDQETPEYTSFSLKLAYTSTYDATKLYKLAVIFSASEDGAAYNAAIGSRLLIDDVTIVTE